MYLTIRPGKLQSLTGMSANLVLISDDVVAWFIMGVTKDTANGSIGSFDEYWPSLVMRAIIISLLLTLESLATY